MRDARRAVILAATGVLVAAGCVGSGEDEYYQAYLLAEAELENMGAQLDSTLIRIRDLESAVVSAEREVAGAEVSVTETQLHIVRDPPSAEYHALQARERITRARSLLNAVAP